MRSASDEPPTGDDEPSGSASVGLAFDADAPALPIPAELPILPLRGVVIFPSAIAPLLISRLVFFSLVLGAFRAFKARETNLRCFAFRAHRLQLIAQTRHLAALLAQLLVRGLRIALR